MKIGLGIGLKAGMVIAQANDKDSAIEMAKSFPEYHEISSQRGYMLTTDQTGEAIYRIGENTTTIYTQVVLELAGGFFLRHFLYNFHSLGRSVS